MIRASWLLFAAALVPSRSNAQSTDLERAVRVDVERSGCVTARALRERIGAYLGSGLRPAELEVAIDLGREPASFRLRLGDAVIAERRFDRLPPACPERTDAIALAVAVAIEHALPPRMAAETRAPSPPSAAAPIERGASPDAAPANDRAAASPTAADARASERTELSAQAAQRSAGASEAREPAPEPSAAADDRTSSPPPSDLAEPEPTNDQGAAPAPRGARWQVFAGGAYLLEVATTPLVAFTLGAEFAPLPVLRFHVAGFVTPDAEERFAGGRVSSRAAGGHALGCLYSPLAQTIASACAGVGAGLVHAEGDEYDVNLDDDMAWLAGIARIAVEIPAESRLALRVAVEARANIVRPGLTLEGDDEDIAGNTRVFGASVGGEIVIRID